MNKLQVSVVGLVTLLFIAFVFGGRIKPNTQAQIEKSRALSAEHLSVEDLIIQSKAEIDDNSKFALQELEDALTLETSDSARSEILKKISGKWYALNQHVLSGHFAERVAEIEKTDEAWAIAGINYNLGFQRSEDEKIRQYGFEQAVKAFENAISENPEETTHKINLYLCYINNPQRTMEGVKGLQGMLESDPNNAKILITLGRLSVNQTRDFEKAVNRLEKAIAIEPNNIEANYLLAEAYTGLNRTSEALTLYKKCLELSDDELFKAGIKNKLGITN